MLSSIKAHLPEMFSCVKDLFFLRAMHKTCIPSFCRGLLEIAYKCNYHNSVIFLRHSNQHRQEFENMAMGLV